MPDDRWTRHVRYYRWMRRLLLPLDSGTELWIDPRTRPDFAAWEALAHRRGEEADASSLGYFMTRTLLHDVLFAAGSVEAEFLRLGDALADAQEWTDNARQELPQRDDIERAPEFREHTGAPSLLDGHFAFWNLLSGLRAVQDRVDRRFRPGRAERVGLLPAMASGPRRDRVADALARFQTRTKDTRAFANFVLHSGTIPGGGTPRAEVQGDGRIRVPLPDAPTGAITTWEEFEFTQGRDMWTYAEDMMVAVEQFIDEVLSAFEDHVPERFRS
jgi:hypothetical protein